METKYQTHWAQDQEAAVFQVRSYFQTLQSNTTIARHSHAIYV